MYLIILENHWGLGTTREFGTCKTKKLANKIVKFLSQKIKELDIPVDCYSQKVPELDDSIFVQKFKIGFAYGGRYSYPEIDKSE